MKRWVQRLPRRIWSWWSRRPIQFRTSLVATAVALVGLGLISRTSVGVIGWLMMQTDDKDLRVGLSMVAGQPVPPRTYGGAQIRVLDTTGQPIDGSTPVGLRPWEVNELKSGQGVLEFPHYWVGVVVPDAQGAPRLVLAGSALVGYHDTLVTADQVLGTASLIAAMMVGLATWLVVRRSLRPVERLRIATASLPEGQRLPVPEANDELRALAEALNAMLARRDADTEWLRRFTGDAAHELRNPVAAIRAQAEVAVVHPDPELAQETLQDIASEAQRLSDLVEGLLALAHAESGTRPEASPVELTAAVRAAADRRNMRGSSPRVQVVVPSGAVVIKANPTEVATVLDNLIVNALRYCRALVRVSVLPAGSAVRLVVDDDGPGIPAEHRTRVFDRFHRVQGDRARSTGGSGLGLALVAEAVRRRGGSVRAAESPEGGARLEIRWPLPAPFPAQGASSGS
jgi:two-component system OmpR family sensor kinase